MSYISNEGIQMKSFRTFLLFTALLLTGCADAPAESPKYPYLEGTIEGFYISQYICSGSYSTIVFSDGRAITFDGVSPAALLKKVPVRVYYDRCRIVSIIEIKKDDIPGTKDEPLPDVPNK
jgi:hypothetical protein